ncbi:MAG: hypothetical protein J1F02_07855 [Lachnospiraceae bacterium]|nr:hypothetical protein [Lachnospiraceae bacterium]
MKQHHPRIPTREEFHREFAGVIRMEDFSTCYPPYRRPERTRQELENLKNYNRTRNARKENL